MQRRRARGAVGARAALSAYGRTVNLAARVQALTREHKVDILLTEEVRSQLDPGFKLREMPPAEVKGFAGEVATFALLA